MVRAWKMHFLPAVELLAKFPCVNCTESPLPGMNQLFRFLLLSGLWASSAHAEQPGELHWNFEFWSTAQRPDLPSNCRRHLHLVSMRESFMCRWLRAKKSFLPYHNVGDHLPSAGSFNTTWVFYNFVILVLSLCLDFPYPESCIGSLSEMVLPSLLFVAIQRESHKDH